MNRPWRTLAQIGVVWTGALLIVDQAPTQPHQWVVACLVIPRLAQLLTDLLR